MLFRLSQKNIKTTSLKTQTMPPLLQNSLKKKSASSDFIKEIFWFSSIFTVGKRGWEGGSNNPVISSINCRENSDMYLRRGSYIYFPNLK